MPCSSPFEWYESLKLGNHPDVNHPVVDVEQMILDKAWEFIDISATCFRTKKGDRKNKKLIVDWNFIDIETKIVEWKTREDTEDPIKKLALFETSFENLSDKIQSFNFKADRQTESSAELSVQEGFTIGGSFNLSFSSTGPEGIGPGLTAAMGGNASWTGSRGKKMTKTNVLTWGVDNQISLDSGKSVTASLEIKENNFVAEMTLKTTLTMTSKDGTIAVDVRSAKDDRLLELMDLSIHDVFSEIKVPKIEIVDEEDLKQVIITSKALCRGVSGIEQNVIVKPNN